MSRNGHVKVTPVPPEDPGIRLGKKEVVCERDEWADLAQILAYRSQNLQHFEFIGVFEKAKFTDGNTQSKAPYAEFRTYRRGGNGKRAFTRIPFDAKELRYNPQGGADTLFGIAAEVLARLLAKARVEGKEYL